MSLWGGLAAYMIQNGYETMLGCASVAMSMAATMPPTCIAGSGDALTSPEYSAFPHTPLPVEELRTGAKVSPPPLLKGYLRLGAKICGAPAWDPDFNTADFLTLLRISEIKARYARHFMGDAHARGATPRSDGQKQGPAALPPGGASYPSTQRRNAPHPV